MADSAHAAAASVDETNAQLVECESKITRVVVYSDRAQVTRTTKVEVKAGFNIVSFTELPNTMIRSSVQVSVGAGASEQGIVLHGVTHQNIVGTAPPLTEQQEELKKVNKEIKILERRSAGLDKDRNLSKEMLNNTIRHAGQGTQWDFDRYTELAEYTQQQSVEVAKEKMEIQEELRKLQQRQQFLQSSIQFNHLKRGSVHEATLVKIHANNSGAVVLGLSYIITNASWRPVYDLRVNSSTDRVEITYCGVVSQRTGENWEDVSVQLSTAKPHLGGQQPELSPWRVEHEVDIHPHLDGFGGYGGGARMQLECSNMMPMAAPQMMQQMMPMARMKSASAVISALPPPPSLRVAASQVSTGSTSVVFTVAGKHTINTNGEDSKVTVLRQEFDGYMRFSAVPKLSPHTYLKAKIVNTTEYPFLQGSASVYLDNSFVSETQLSMVPPGADFWVFLGTDEAVSVTRVTKNKTTREESTLMGAKKKKTAHEYDFKVKNNKPREIELVVWDQLPISPEKDIQVKLVKPERESDTFKRNEIDFVEWILHPQPRQEVVFPFAFTVEYPQGTIVGGL